MRLIPIIILLFTISLPAQQSITDEHFNLIGSDIYIKTDKPYFRKTPPSNLYFPTEDVTLNYIQSSDIASFKESINFSEESLDPLVKISEQVIDSKNVTRMNISTENVQLTSVRILVEIGSIGAMIQLEYKKDKSTEFVEDLIKSLVFDFSQSLEASNYLPFSLNIPDGFDFSSQQIPGMLLIMEKGTEPFQGSGIMFGESSSYPETEYEDLKKTIKNRDEASSKLIEGDESQLLMIDMESPNPEINAFQFIKIEGKFVVTGAASYKSDEDRIIIEKTLTSIKKN